MKDENSPPQPHPCPGCGGSGQTSYFAGESRFMLTREDCPDCAGTGIMLSETSDPMENPESGGNKQSSAKDHQFP